MIAHDGLRTADEALRADPATLNIRQVLIRHLILELGNVADVAAISGSLYKGDVELGELYQAIRKGLELFKYLRNIYVGHLARTR